jgi:hypothetical protein
MNIETFINQVENKDKNTLRQFINSLFLVSNDMLENYIRETLGTILGTESTIALFTITDNADTDNYDSSDKIGYMLENIRRLHSREIYVNPTIETLKKNNIRKIVLVEDNISS